MEEERILKKVLNGNFHTTRPVGRPRSRWADVVQRDALQLLGIRRWRIRAANRDEWKHLMSSAVGRGRAYRPDHDQQHCYHHAPTVKSRGCYCSC
jgi:hypothetical protein